MQVATPPRHVYLHEVDYVHAKRKVFVVVCLSFGVRADSNNVY